MKHLALCVCVAAFTLGFAIPSQADTIPITMVFDCITDNSAVDCNILENQLQLQAWESGGNVNFKFSNLGPAASSIADVYFRDAGELLQFHSLSGSTGVSFSAGCSPPDLPGMNGFLDGFCADSDPPTQQNGVNPGEWLIVNFLYESGVDFDDVTAALTNRSLQTGIHVQGFASGGSESGINRPPTTTVPEPATISLLGFGLIVISLVARKNKKH